MKTAIINCFQFLKKYALIFTLVVVFINIILGAWPILNNDIFFKSDVARDFLLFEEISQKGIILIGPRASGMPGLFHGPLWIYLNYPAYIIGQGNPIFVGYFWIILNILFLFSSYILAKKLFNQAVANVYIILLSAATIFYINSLFNPYGAMMILPLFLYTFIRYTETLNGKYFLYNLLAVGAIIQFQMAVGLPLLILTSIYALYIIRKHKLFRHLLFFSVLIIPFSTFILFDIRHNFGQFNTIISSFTSESSIPYTPYMDRLVDRWNNITTNLFLAQGIFSSIINKIIFIVLVFFTYMRLRAKKDAFVHKYFILIYFYLGFYIVSIMFNGILLGHYTFPVIPLIFLIFSSTVLYLNRKVFLSILLILVVVNIWDGVIHAQNYTKVKGNTLTSWQFQHQAVKKVFESANEEFGYYIYAPDYYAYAQKYAYSYTKKLYPDKKSYLAQKKPITYTVVEPAPPDRKELTDVFWIKSLVKIQNPPEKVLNYPNGFAIKEYRVTDKDLQESSDPQTAEWIHFR